MLVCVWVCKYVVGQYIPNGASNLFHKFLVATSENV